MKKYPSGCATSGGGGQRTGSAAGFHPTTGGSGGGSGSGPGSASSMSPRFAAATFSSAAEAQYYTTTAAGGTAAAAAAAAEAAARGGSTGGGGGSRMLHHAAALFHDGDDEDDEDIDLQMQHLDQTVRQAAAATGSLRRASGKATMEDVCDNLDGGGGVAVVVGGGGSGVGGTSLHVGPSLSSNHRRRQNLRRRPRTLSRQMAELNLDQSEEDELLRVTRDDAFLSVASAARDRFVPSPAPNGGGLSPATMLARPSPHPPPLPPELAAVVSSVAAIPATSSSYHASSAINNATGGIMLANLGAGTMSSHSNHGSLMTTLADVEASLAPSSVAAPVTSAGNTAVPSTAASVAAAAAAPKQINFTSLTTIPENPSESRNTSMVSQDSWQNFSQLSSLGPRDRIGDARANANYNSNQSLDMVDALHDHEVAAVTAAAAARTSTSTNMTSAAGFHTTAGIGGDGSRGGGGGGGIIGSNNDRGVNSRAIMQQQQQRSQQLQQQQKTQQRPQQLDTSGKTSSGVANKLGATPKQSQFAAAAGAGNMMLWKKVQQTVVFGGSFITQGKGGHVEQQQHQQHQH